MWYPAQSQGIKLETYCSEARIILLSMGSTGSSAILRPSWIQTNKDTVLDEHIRWIASFIYFVTSMQAAKPSEKQSLILDDQIKKASMHIW